MKTAIIYRSVFGATKQYAEWLKEATGADMHTFGDVSDETLRGYDWLVISSGTYAGFMPLNRFLKKRWEVIKDKKVIVVAVGSVPPDDPWSKKSYERIPTEIRERITYFKLPGKADEKKSKIGGVKKENLAPVLEVLREG